MRHVIRFSFSSLAVLALAVMVACSSSTGPSSTTPHGSVTFSVVGGQSWVGDSVPGDSLIMDMSLGPEYGPNTSHVHVDYIIPTPGQADTTHGCAGPLFPPSTDSLHTSGFITQISAAPDSGGHVYFKWVFGSQVGFQCFSYEISQDSAYRIPETPLYDYGESFQHVIAAH